MLHAGKPDVNSGEKRDFASSGFTIRPKGGILYPYHSKIQEETMDIRQLHYFLVLCEEMNYTRAAQRLFLSRQALRQSISPSRPNCAGRSFSAPTTGSASPTGA